MTSPKTLICLLLLVGLASAFDASQYLYSYEANASLTYTDFTLDGDSYSIVEVSGKESFLLKDDEVVEDADEIESVIYAYYLDEYYPSEQEISDLRGYLEEYNESRNDGQKFIGKEEYACRSVLFIDGRVKTGADQKPTYCRSEADADTCNVSAMLMWQFLSSLTTPPVSSWNELLEPIRDFGFASYGMDTILADATEKLEEAEEDETKMYDALDFIEESIPEMEDYQEDIEDSMFGWTKNKTCDADHWCLCPDMELDDTVFASLEDQVDDLKEKMEPFSRYEDVASDIYTESSDRIKYSTGERLAVTFSSQFDSLDNTGEAAIALGDEAVDRVSNGSLSAKLLNLKSYHQTIPEDIESRNFNTTEADLQEYEVLIKDVRSMATVLLDQYNETRNAKNLANSMILVLESKDLDPISLKSFNLLKNHTEDLDAEFRDGLSITQLITLEQDYTEVTMEAQELLKSEVEMPATKVLLMFRGYARQVNNGIASMAEQTDVMTRREIADNSLPLGIFSALVFVSLSSIVLLTFLFVMSTMKFRVPKTPFILTSAFLCILALLLLFSVFMFLFLSKTSSDATLPEFLTDFNSKESAAIVVDLREAPYADADAMSSCASNLANSFEDGNKSWTVYTLTQNTCSKKVDTGTTSSLNVDSCLNTAEEEDSLFFLGYSASNEPAKFSVIYKNKAEIKANLDYYESCPLVALFS